ncbi:hypothetical protein OP10G_2997 [Fimbriimonas ginsengisoli Gsoil 348]|uniref:Uncharacterized protein n=2 Tax=Fimbriimonas ginsengisoli TaxID=1005039 RepID=A0A068NUA9_FIMGI|nr:hypothetical protein OP10G_2997 [Fimbriimonas ginsengisoli Gsoil 348]
MGGDKCRSCGFVPVGAGLDKLPKKKKKRNRKYVEPGSARGLLVTLALGMAGVGAWVFKPWEDDWELVRSLFGQGRHHSVVGEWEIVKTLEIKKGKSVFAANRVNKGTLKFSKDGSVKLAFQRGGGKTDAQGKYLVSGRLVAMNSIQASEAQAGILPTSMKLDLSWTGPDSVVASCNGAEAIYLRRHPEGNPLVQLLRMGLKPQKADSPGAMRGSLSTMQTNDQSDSGE